MTHCFSFTLNLDYILSQINSISLFISYMQYLSRQIGAPKPLTNYLHGKSHEFREKSLSLHLLWSFSLIYSGLKH